MNVYTTIILIIGTLYSSIMPCGKPSSSTCKDLVLSGATVTVYRLTLTGLGTPFEVSPETHPKDFPSLFQRLTPGPLKHFPGINLTKKKGPRIYLVLGDSGQILELTEDEPIKNIVIMTEYSGYPVKTLMKSY